MDNSLILELEQVNLLPYEEVRRREDQFRDKLFKE